MVIYLVAAMVISRKEEILKEAEGEEGMMHSILSRLPDMFPDGENDDGNGDALPAISAVAKPSTSEPEAKQANPEPSAVEPIPSEVTSDPPPPYQPSEDIAQNDPSTIEHSTATQPPSTAPTKLVPISRLLKHADELFALYPPSHPSLCVDTIMGPNSVIFTWSENDHVDLSQPKGEEGPRPSSSGEKTSSSVGTSQRCLPSDDAAEEMVLDRSSVVFPYDPESEFPQESDNEGVYKPRPPRPKRSLPRGWIDLTRIDKRTVLAAMVVLLGVGIALYAGSDYRRRANTQVMWKALVGWAGSFVAGLVGMDDDAYE
ncbi:hypothetical protein FRB99_000788 [Tulasnella sp. 403]|nr:hypothetical protein FRB99_000788 [Tulasnella sp. 403]